MPVKGLAELNARIDRFARRLVPEQLTALQKKVAIEVTSGAIQLTPVDTGRARGGWQVSVGAPVSEPPKTVDPSGDGTLAAAVQVLEQLPPFNVVFVQNNVEYIGFIEEGTDKVAPVAMLQRSLDRVSSIFPGGGA